MGSLFSFTDPVIENVTIWKEEQETVAYCEDHIYLNSDTSPITGMLRFDRTPWISEILDDWDKKWVEQHNIMASTQVGKTTIEFCCLMKELDTDPCMMQLTIPTEDGVSAFLKKKLNPFMRGVKTIQGKIKQHKSLEKLRVSDAIKEVPGGTLFVLGNTAVNRRSNTVKNMFIDEAALFGKGHIKELIGRTKFHEKSGRKIFIVSSRKHAGDEIEVTYENSYCKKDLQIECPACGESFYPERENFHYLSEAAYKKKQELTEIKDFNAYKREAIQTAHVKCECGHQIDDRGIEALVMRRKVYLVIIEGAEEDTIHGYRLNALATGLTKYSTIAEMLIEAGEDPEELATVYQDYFNEIYEKEYAKAEGNDLLLLGNGLEELVVPEETYKIFMGVDTQKDHFWYEIKAYCYGNISHSLISGRLETFAEVEDIWIAGQHLVDAAGEEYMIAKMGIDRRGYNQDGVRRTDEVDAFVDYMIGKYRNGDENRIYATEGHPTLTGDKPYIIGSIKDDSDARNPVDIKVVKLSNLYLKNSVQLSISRAIDKAKAESDEDKEFHYHTKLFYINQDTIETDSKGTVRTSYTEQLTSEVFDFDKHPKTGKLAKTKTWINPKKRDNHLFDTSVICEAFAYIDKISLKKKTTDTGIAAALSGLSSLHG